MRHWGATLVVTGGGFVIAGILLAQAIYTIWTGQSNLFLTGTKFRHPPFGFFGRLLCALMFMFPGVGIIVILVTKLKGITLGPFWQWLSQDSGLLFYLVLLGGWSALNLIKPAMMLRWMLRRTNPEIANSKEGLIVIQVVSWAIICGVLFGLSKM
jgi:hypothetical protein